MRNCFGFLILLSCSCSLSEKNLTGIYIDSERGDTLRVKPDKTYTFDEKLMNGNVGFTKGTWQLVNKQVQFSVQPKILMGYSSKVVKDSATQNPIFDFYLGNSEQPVQLDEADGYREGLISPAKNITVTNNRLQIQQVSFDSLDVGMQEFLPITIPPSFFTNHHYRVKIFPAERYYEFDRYLFEYKKNSLRNVNKPGLPGTSIVLKKTD